MEYNNQPVPKMSGDNIASCFRSVTILVGFAVLVYLTNKIDPKRFSLKWKDAELQMSRI